MVSGRAVVRRGNCFPAIAGNLANPAARLWARACNLCLFAVLVPVLTGEVIKWVVGRGRPFVGGEANVFNFAHFDGTEAYASFPSGHAITSFALAFAVSAVWPQARAIDDCVCGSDLRSVAWCCWPIIPATWSLAR